MEFGIYFYREKEGEGTRGEKWPPAAINGVAVSLRRSGEGERRGDRLSVGRRGTQKLGRRAGRRAVVRAERRPHRDAECCGAEAHVPGNGEGPG